MTPAPRMTMRTDRCLAAPCPLRRGLLARLRSCRALRLGLRRLRCRAPSDMGIGHDLDARARHHQLGDDRGPVRIGLVEGLRIDGIHARKVGGIGQIDQNLSDVLHRSAGGFHRAPQIAQREFGLNADIALFDRAVLAVRNLRGIENAVSDGRPFQRRTHRRQMCLHWFTHWFAPLLFAVAKTLGCIPTRRALSFRTFLTHLYKCPTVAVLSSRVQAITIGQCHGGRRAMIKTTIRGATPRRVSRRRFLAGGIAAATIIGIHSRRGSAQDIKTIEAGKLTIGMNGDMPMTQVKDGKLSGTDGELMIYVAEKLGLEPKIVQMDWAALIEATKQGKVDVMHGALDWIDPRTKIMNLSEAIYYFGTLLAQKSANNFSTFADIQGRSVGTVTGFTLVPELKGVEGRS